MKQTRIVESTKFEVWNADGDQSFIGEYKTKGDAYKAIVEAARFFEPYGGRPFDYIIVQTKTGREFGENGEFISAYTNTRVVYNTEQIKKFMEQGL